MFICDLINNIFLYNIYNLDNSLLQKDISKDSLDYFKKNKLELIQEELALLKDIEITLWNNNNSPYKSLFNEINRENLKNKDFELLEIIIEKEFGKFYLLKTQLIICNFTLDSIFKSNLFKENVRNGDDIIENVDFNIDNITFLFDTNKKILIDLFNLDLTNLDLEDEKRNYLLILLIKYIIIFQNKNGWIIIKLNSLDNDVFLRQYIYLLSSLYIDSSLIRPSILNNFTSEVYFVGKNYYLSNNHKLVYLNETIELLNLLSDKSFCQYRSLLKNNLPKIYVDKLKELRMIIGQSNMEHYDLLLSVLKSKNKEEKLLSLEYQNKCKCEYWIEKYLSV